MAKDKVLIVDDDSMYQKILATVFEGFEIETAENGKSALEIAARFKPDIIILDIVMPDMDGYAVCEAFRALKPTATTPIIFSSSLDSTAGRLKAYDLGGTDYFSKSSATEEMLVKAKALLNSENEREVIKQEAAIGSNIVMTLQRESSRLYEVNQFIKACQFCSDLETLSTVFLNCLRKLNTRGVVYFPEKELYASSNERISKLESEILKTADEFNRIHSFGASRALFNWTFMKLLVKDVGEMVDTLAYLMDSAESAIRSINMQNNLVEQIVRIEAQNRELRNKLADTAKQSKESLKEQLIGSGLISSFDIQDEKDLEDMLAPYGNDLNNFLESMNNNASQITSLLGQLKTPPDELKEYFQDISADGQSNKGDEVLF